MKKDKIVLQKPRMNSGAPVKKFYLQLNYKFNSP